MFIFITNSRKTPSFRYGEVQIEEDNDAHKRRIRQSFTDVIRR